MTDFAAQTSFTQRREGFIPTLAVDIDETIAATVDKWMSQLLKEFPIEGFPTPGELIAAHRFAQNVPAWRENSAAMARMQEFRECPIFHLDIHPIAGATEALATIEKFMRVQYLTMRNEKVVEATNVWLKQNGFPAGAIEACPGQIPLDEKPAWKASVLSQRFPDVIGIIEDHPHIIELLPANYAGTVFLFSHHESPRTDINVIPCPTWQDVERHVRLELPRLLGIDRSA